MQLTQYSELSEGPFQHSSHGTSQPQSLLMFPECPTALSQISPETYKCHLWTFVTWTFLSLLSPATSESKSSINTMALSRASHKVLSRCQKVPTILDFLLFSPGKFPHSHALPTDATDTACSAFHQVLGLIRLCVEVQLPSLMILADTPPTSVIHRVPADLSSSPPTFSVPKTYTSNYSIANKGTGTEANFFSFQISGSNIKL